MPLTPSTRLGTYEILAPLGAGGMGEVYRARDLRLGREIALKVLPPDVSASADRLARFEREARAVAALNHPNIVVLYSIEEAAGARFLTMELVEGRSLSELVTPGGLPLGQVLELAIPLADALVAAHERRVVHRDLKPANVMVARDGRVKVLDFGLAKLEQVDAVLEITKASTTLSPISDSGQVIGTAPYMAPEQIRGEEVDARADLFSFGILVYELAAGMRPFGGRTPADVSSAILRDPPPPLTSVRADLPAELGHILERCLEKQPRERFQTALDVANELRGLRRTLERGTPRGAKAAAGAVASIAVLPFVNRSASADDEYFSDGLADELLNLLSKIRGLRVAARTSAFHFKGKDTTIAEVGKALNVATVLEGSVRKAGQRVRISVRLVKVAEGYHLWSESYDRTLEDIFAVQDNIAQSVVRELRTALLGEEADSSASGEVRAEVAKAAQGRGTNPEAHRIFLQARHLIDQGPRADAAKAIEYLKQALELDPLYALAWAELSGAYAREADRGWVPPAEGYGRAREAVERALALEPDLADGHSKMGWIQLNYERDWRGAGVSLRRALELAPGNAEVLRRAGVLARVEGRLEEATGLFLRAVEQDPLSATAYHSLGLALATADRNIEAEAAYRKALELAPQRDVTRSSLSWTLLTLGRSEEALAEAAGDSDEGLRLWAVAMIQEVTQGRELSDPTLRQLIEKCADEYAFQIAEVYGVRKDTDAALAWLERAYAQRDPGFNELKNSPRLRSLHGDARWETFLKKKGLEE